MAGLDINTGQLADHDSGVLPLADTGSGIDAISGVTPVASIVPDRRGNLSDYGAVFDATAQLAADMASGEADCRAAQAAGMDARTSMVHGMEAVMLPLGSSPYAFPVPDVPDNAMPPSDSFLYPWSGDEPTPVLSPFGGGDEPGR